MTFQDQQLNSMTFQVFHDLYEPCFKRGVAFHAAVNTC